MSREFSPAAGGKIAPKYNFDTVKKSVSQFEQPSKNFWLHSSEDGSLNWVVIVAILLMGQLIWFY